MTSDKMSTIPEKTRAAAVDNMMIPVSFCLIGRSRNACQTSIVSPYFCTDLATVRSLELIVSSAWAAAF